MTDPTTAGEQPGNDVPLWRRLNDYAEAFVRGDRNTYRLRDAIVTEWHNGRKAFEALRGLTEALLTRADAPALRRQIDAAVQSMADHRCAPPVPWPDADFELERWAGRSAAAAQAAKQVPADFVLVPREPTDAMVDAGFNCTNYGTTVQSDIERAWSSMLAAAPSATSPVEAAEAGQVEAEPSLLRLFLGAAYPVDTSIDARGYRWCEVYLDQARASALAATPEVAMGEAAEWLFVQMGDDGRAYLTWCFDASEIEKAVAGAVFVEPAALNDDERIQVHGITARLIEDGFFDFEGDPGLKLFHVSGNDLATTPASPQAPAPQGKYDGSWSVFNSGGACIIENVTFPLAADYMTPDRFARGWTMVSVIKSPAELAEVESIVAAPATQAVVGEAMRDAIAASLGDLYVCSRVWEAWQVGTMSQDDFSPAWENDDVIDNIASAVEAALISPAPSAAPHQGADALREALERIAAGDVMRGQLASTGCFSHADTVLAYQSVARAALAQHQAPQQGEQQVPLHEATIIDYFEAIHEDLSDVVFICKTAAEVQREIDWFIATRTQQLERFGEHRQEAERVIEQTIRQMRKVHADRVAHEALEAENATLREQLARKVIDSTLLTDVVIKNGAISIGLEGGACALLVEAFASQFKESSAENYLEASFTSKVLMPGESFVVTIQRQSGKTPHQLRLEAEARVQALEAELAVVQQGGAR